jgi:hypothetical protein
MLWKSGIVASFERLKTHPLTDAAARALEGKLVLVRTTGGLCPCCRGEVGELEPLIAATLWPEAAKYIYDGERPAICLSLILVD